ncbi:RBBP9/YdeN family alpha/beta hydrolase [Mucilaginibacter pocheonensis]|uniref:Alpha/beta hydrolase family esterase n=1 Tax=Mucilaginibacter pocheonensis TaxID=398050 RepID=A0ABU1TB40_9SPHI|nr:alpha/beta hydrolase [Mucilaginibacter pocheonensis]MDR6942548.1 putative alpha/beta hydrolase family esterase [Mucilaginibacter pocheonensis]
MTFNSTIIIHPGLGNSGPAHWQSLWEKQFGFNRVEQKDWETPVCTDWINTLNSHVQQHDSSNVILVGHSLACTTIAYWAQKFKVNIKGALLVAPSDTEADTYPPGTSGFTPVPLITLPFKSIVVASSNDYYVTPERAALFADSWGSELVNIGDAGHINVASGYGEWAQGLELLKQLDN